MFRKKIIVIGLLDSLRLDARQVLRQIRNSVGFSAIVVVMIAAGLGVATAIFSTVRTVLLSPLPYKDSEQLVQIISTWPKTGDKNNWSAPYRDALDWKTTVAAFRDIGMYRYSLLNLTESAPAESLYGVRATAGLLPLLGVRPYIGQWFSSEDDRPGHTHELVLSYDLWRRRFQADPQIVGKVVHLNGDGYLVLGVMPKGFNFPLRLATTAQLPTDQMQFWMPLGADLGAEEHGAPNAGVIARLKPGVSLPAAQSQLEAACLLLQSQYPATNKDLSARLVPLREQTVDQINGPLLALLAAAGLILLLTCANVASLLLAKGQSSAHELAVRMALGGSVSRVARIPLLHGVVLSLCGCLLGVPLSVVILRFLIQLAPIDVPRLADAHIDSQAIAFELALTLLSALVVGGLNAFQVLRRSPRDVLSDAAKTSSGPPRTKLRSTLVIGQVALAVILVTGAGLMLRTFLNLLSTDTGYQPDRVLYAVNALPPSRYPTPEGRALFYKKVLDRLRVAPGIESAAASTGFPLVGEYPSTRVQAADSVNGDNGAGVTAEFNVVSPGYLETMGVRLISGRTIRETDTADTAQVAVIDATLATRLWPGQDPLGKLINTGDPANPIWRQVAGVIAQTRNTSLERAAQPNVFVPLAQAGGWVNFVIVKSRLSPEEAATVVKNVVSSVDPNQFVFFSQSMSQLIRDVIAVRHFLFTVLVFFGASAIGLSAVGIYGLVSFIATSRVHEVGIRMALGATPVHIVSLVVFQSIRLTLIGILAGLLGSLFLGRSLSSLLFGVRPNDPLTLALTAVLLGMVTILAALGPAFRSAQLRPMQALRRE
jgi:putative ABC transport system permease protein